MGSYEARSRIRDLLEVEKGGCRKQFGSARSFGLIYPNTYHVGMSNLGVQLIYKIINENTGWLCERMYCDFQPLLSMESQQPPGAFDVLAFSVSFELDYLNMVDFLDRASIPLLAENRGGGWPLVIGAGVCMDVNRHPAYEFVDVIVNGEGEELTGQFLRLFEEHEGNRRAMLEALSALEGFEVTAGARRCHGMDLPRFDGFTVPRMPRVTTREIGRHMNCSHIVTPNTEFADMCLVELARGCPYRCTFCYVGHNLNPYRTVPLATLKEWIAERREWTDRFGFVASAVASHPRIDDLCLHCDELGIKVSYSSLRAEDVTPVMIRTLARSGAQTLTIAPEAGSFRLRRLLGKARLPDERIEWVVQEAVKAGIPNLKMYFMIGIPTETEEDILEIPTLIRKVQKVFVDASRPWGRAGAVSLNSSIFIPLHSTPLEKFEPMPFRQARKHAQLLHKHLQGISNLRFQMPSPALAQVQAILSKGDLRTAGFLLDAHREGGNWRAALRGWERVLSGG